MSVGQQRPVQVAAVRVQREEDALPGTDGIADRTALGLMVIDIEDGVSVPQDSKSVTMEEISYNFV